ncbi:MAG: alpha/beta hydrolase [Bacteroidetes bacterium]|nr:alpha/beta hydrolase [Bacteroidota bacterium]
MVPDSRFTHANGINLHYLDWRGSGPTVVCLHGLTSQAHTWDQLAEALAPQYRVIALDLRGHGDSEKPPVGYTTGDFAADLEGFVKRLGITPFILMGHSLGARIAALYAGLHCDRLSHLVLEDPAFPIRTRPGNGANPIIERENARPASFANLEEAIQFIGSETDLMATQPHRERWTKEALRKYTLDALTQRADGAWEWKYSHRAVLEIIDQIEKTGHADIMAGARNIVTPTLLIRGGDSQVCPPENADEINAVIPNCRVVAVPGVGHGIHQEKFPEFLAAIREFLS